MAKIIIEDVEPGIVEKLEALAKEHGRSLQAELKHILESAAKIQADSHPEKMTAPKTPEELGWTPGFFERTFGAWEGEPLTREEQGEYEQREELL